jgi:hypothetical protein
MLSIALTVALTIGVLALVLLPLWRRGVPQQPEPDEAHASVAGDGRPVSHDELLTRRDALYAMLRDAEFDHHMGKLGEADYQALRARAMREAAQVLQQLDRLSPEAEAAIDRDIEQAVAHLRALAPHERRAALPATALEAVETELATLIRHASAAPQAGKLACPNCGQAYRAGDAFCIHCGTDLGSGARGQGT